MTDEILCCLYMFIIVVNEQENKRNRAVLIYSII